MYKSIDNRAPVTNFRLVVSPLPHRVFPDDKQTACAHVAQTQTIHRNLALDSGSCILADVVINRSLVPPIANFPHSRMKATMRSLSRSDYVELANGDTLTGDSPCLSRSGISPLVRDSSSRNDILRAALNSRNK